jgi:sphingolipid delta-4 desaturase
MKKNKADFQKRYGDRWKSVMYATATKSAMKEQAELDEVSQETLRNYHAKAALDLRKKREKLDKGTLTSKDYKQGQNRVTGLNRAANKIAGMIANIPLIFPSSVSFETYHLKHHSFQGVHELDGDLPNYWEAKLINHYFIGKVIWLLFYPLFQVFRLSRLREIAPFDKWVALNWLIQIVSMTAIVWFLGAQSFVYLVASFFFSVGLHPLGARWIQEHYLTQGEQETYSYYGVLNHVAFNVGFHNEHHDFPSVPWNRLPDIKKTAPGFYDHLSSHTSWTKLFLRFLFDQEISLFSRVVRKNRGKVSLTDESRPDAELSI